MSSVSRTYRAGGTPPNGREHGRGRQRGRFRIHLAQREWHGDGGPGDPDAEDLAQQALLKVFSRISEFDTDRDGVAWAFGIAANEVRTQRKRLQRRREVGDALDTVPDRACSPEQVVLDDDLSRALSAALGELSASDRAVLAPSNKHQMTGPVDAAGRKRRQRALDRLRAIWSRLYA